MFKRRKRITAIFLLVMFLLPLWVKLEHHHEHLADHANKEKQVHEYHEPCAICSFEFSILDLAFDVIDLTRPTPEANYRVFNKSNPFFDLSAFTFLLRAPPCKMIG
jgi:Ca2+/H+ antiporter